MKTIKKITTVLAITGLLFVSCDKKSDKEYKTMEIQLADGQSVNYKVTNTGSLAFNNWDG